LVFEFYDYILKQNEAQNARNLKPNMGPFSLRRMGELDKTDSMWEGQSEISRLLTKHRG
jgi:hypothetical protein